MGLTEFNMALFIIAITAITIGALLKGMTGVGLPLIAVPAIATFTSVEEAVVLMIIPTLGSNLWLVATHRRFAELLRAHLPFLVAGFLGGIIGTFILTTVDDRWLKLALAAWLALYLLQFALGDFLQSLFQAKGAAAVVGFCGGAIQGASGISAHIVAPYFHGRKVAVRAYAFLVACAFLTFSAAQLVTAAGTQLFSAERLLLGCFALIPTLVFTRVGIRFAGKISQAAFQKLLIALFVLMEIKLLADVF